MTTSTDPQQSEQSGCPYAGFRAMREQAAVTQVQPGVYAVTRYDDVKAVLSDSATFAARLGENNAFAMYGPSPVQSEIDAIMREYPEEPVLMRTDPPLHTRVRALVNCALTPAEVQKIEPQIHAIVKELAAPWLERGAVDFTGEFARLLPNAVTTSFLGSPPEMRERFRFWAGEVMSRIDGPQTPERQLEVAQHIVDMARYFYEQIAERRRNPTGDLVSLLAHAEIDGDRLDNPSIVNVIETFLIGGHETTMFWLGNSLHYLARNPDMAERLRSDPALIPVFIEEMLRLESPGQSVQRSPTRDVEIGGVMVPKGALLLVYLASANRDENFFPEPDTFKLDRTGPTAARHVAFGYGVHSCLGLRLARAEVQIALAFLLPRMHAIKLAGSDPISYLSNFALRGPTRLMLSFTPA